MKPIAVTSPAVTSTDLVLGALPTLSNSDDDAVLSDLAADQVQATSLHNVPGTVRGLGDDARM